MNSHDRQVRLIKFALEHSGSWHTYSTDYNTVEQVCAAVNLGIIKLNQCGQFKLKSHSHACQFLRAYGHMGLI